MGTFHVGARVENVVDRTKGASLPKLLVDTGSEYTWVPEPVLEKLGINREKKDLEFVMANGQKITRSVGFAIVRVEKSFTVDEVDFLINRLKEDIGINSHKKTSGRKEGQYKIYIGRNSYFDFIDMIKPHIEWDCFKYKTETSGYTKKPHRGEDHSGSILTEDKVHDIFRMRDEGMLQKEIAEKIGASNISAVLSGEQWGHLGLSRPNLKKPRVTKDKKRQVVDMNSQGVSQKIISETLNINQSTVSRLVNQSNLRK